MEGGIDSPLSKEARIPNKDQQRYVGYKERGRIGERSNRRAKLQNTLSFYTLINRRKGRK